MRKKKLVLINGKEWHGIGFGGECAVTAEIAVHTASVGYQEMITDPVSSGQMLLFTNPLIGNCGMNDEDNEGKKPLVAGIIVHDYNDFPSHYRYTETLSEVMEEHGIPGITGVDTREIAAHVRDFHGEARGIIADREIPTEALLQRLRSEKSALSPVAAAGRLKPRHVRTPNHRFDIVAVDCGMRQSAVRRLTDRGCNVTLVPPDWTAERIRALLPDGLFVSDGPGDPAHWDALTDMIRAMQGTLPLFGVGLGHQLIARANGANTYRMQHAHRGGNRPVKTLATGRIDIVSENHGFAVDENSLTGTCLQVAKRDLLDHTVEGLCCAEQMVFSVQFEPHGETERTDLYAAFLRMIDDFGRWGKTHA